MTKVIYKIGNAEVGTLAEARAKSAEIGMAYKVRYISLKDEGLLNPIPDKRR
jgi:hypothetical protein